MRSALAEEQPHRCPRCGRNVCRACLHSGFHLCLTCLRQASEELDGTQHRGDSLISPANHSQICPTCHRLICEHCWSKQGFPRCGDCPKTIKEPVPPQQPSHPVKHRNKPQDYLIVLFFIQLFFCLLLWLNEALFPHAATLGTIILVTLLSILSLTGVLTIWLSQQRPTRRP